MCIVMLTKYLVCFLIKFEKPIKENIFFVDTTHNFKKIKLDFCSNYK